MKLRHDINGLRAIAVIAVLLFHFDSNWLPGGFAGVDVFFVISGFLMTGIIVKGLENETFSVWAFYKSRAKRIVPALAVLCLALLVFGWFFALDIEYQAISKHALSSISFVSNFVYWKESGYFSAGAHEKWLLHTWSLSAEWQFYMIYPLILLGLSRLVSLTNLRWIIAIFAAIGFAFSVFGTSRWPDPAYYLLPTRAWEMLVGGVAFLFPFTLTVKKAQIVEWFGLVAIACAYVLFSKDTPWPGHFALLPVMGTFAVIQAQRQSSIFTNNIIFKKVGAWSYSIYLWHWPLVVFLYTYLELTLVNRLLLIGVSVFLGWASYTWVEQSKRSVPNLVLAACCILLSAVTFNNDGHFNLRPHSKDSRNELLAKYDNYEMDPSGLSTRCNASMWILENGVPGIGDDCISDRPGGVFIWGDSHVGALSIGLRQSLDEDVPFSQLTSSGCAPSFDERRNRSNRFHEGCDYSNSIALASIKIAQPKVVILGMKKNHEHHDWQNVISQLRNAGVEKVLVMGPLPQWGPSLPLVYVKRHMGKEFIADHNFDYSLVKSNRYLSEHQDQYKNFVFIDLFANLCVDKREELSCRAKIGEELMAYDYGHLTVDGSRFIASNYVVPLLF